MAEKTIRVLIKEPRQDALVMEVKNSYGVLRDLIGGGYLESVWVDNGIVMICDEEGKLKGLTPNFVLPKLRDIICGPVFFCSADAEGDFTSLNEEQLALAKKLVEENELV
ncbi:hypothetical protein SDC9_59760 [bioreactor metagenome]|uniref:DUF3846 domain-containing protein n=1 Tax=bioreactor metagenome TaxID=1076179 RepID=A0A644XGW1_9ZZZZ